jgi:phosphate starvation-inducible membrane PsiE
MVMRESGTENAGPAPVPSQRFEDRLSRAVERAAGVLTSLIALLLLGFVLVALIGVVGAVWRPLFYGHDYVEAALDGLDGAFLAIILLELVHTTLSRGAITRQLQQFIAIGITAAVRSGLEVAARAGAGNLREFITSVVLNSVGVLVLVAAWWLVRQRMHADGEASVEG